MDMGLTAMPHSWPSRSGPRTLPFLCPGPREGQKGRGNSVCSHHAHRDPGPQGRAQPEVWTITTSHTCSTHSCVALRPAFLCHREPSWLMSEAPRVGRVVCEPKLLQRPGRKGCGLIQG